MLWSNGRPASIIRAWGRLQRAFRLHGAVGLLRLVPQNVIYALNLGRHRRRRSLDEFDQRFGVDTATVRSVSTLDVPLEIAAHATRYEPIPSIDTYLHSLAVPFEEYTFIDYGCGKGRALLMASDFPFRQIIGVEYSSELAAIARHNIKLYRNPSQRCRAIEVFEGNAALFEPPDTPSVFFLHNPFDELILQQVLDRIRPNRAAHEPADFLIYVDPRHRTCIEKDLNWEIVNDYRSWVVYRRRDGRA
jgi:SAM-dependent methyltransferase